MVRPQWPAAEVLQEMQDAVVRYLVSAAEREHDVCLCRPLSPRARVPNGRAGRVGDCGVSGQAKEPLEFVLDGSYERLLGHAVAMYYNLHSYSVSAPHIWLPRRKGDRLHSTPGL